MRKILFFSFCIIQLALNAQNANIRYESRIDYLYSDDDNCWDAPWTDEEYSALIRIDDNTNGLWVCEYEDDYSGTCYYGENITIRSNSNLAITEFEVNYDMWEDDGGSRCSYGSSDDCRWNGTEQVPFLANYYPSAQNSYNGYKYKGNGDHAWRVEYSWRYYGGTTYYPSCTASTLTCNSGEIRSRRFYLTSGNTYEFETTSGPDTYLRLYSSNGYTISAFDDDGGAGTLSKLSFTPSSNGYYYLEISNFSRSVLSTNAVLSYKKVDPNPVTAPTSISGSNTVCSGDAITLNAVGGSEGSGCTYQWGTGSNIGSNIISGQTSSSYSPSPSSSSTYWVRRYNTYCGVYTNGVTKSITVDTPPSSPTSIDGTNQIACGGGSTNLTAIGGSNGSGAVFQWGTGTSVGLNTIAGASSSTYSPSITSTTDYWVRRVGNTACTNTTAGAVNTIVVLNSNTSDLSAGNDNLTLSSTMHTVPSGSVSSFPYTENFSSPPGCEWSFNSNNETYGRISVVSGMLRHDVTNNGNYSLNTSVLKLNLSGQTGKMVKLNFDYYDANDESDAIYDKVQYSPNGGTTWYDASSTLLSNSSASWTAFPEIILSELSNFSYSSSFLIKWGQYDNYVWGTDGIGVDNIEVTALQPTISTSGTVTPLVSCDGAASVNSGSFTVSGINLQGDITVTAPNTEFEVSLSASGPFSSSVSISPTNYVVASTTIYVRLSATSNGAASGNVLCTSPNATSVTESVSGTTSSPTASISTSTGTTVITCDDPIISLTASGAGTGGTYNWNNGMGSNATYNASMDMPYSVTVTDANGCTDTETIDITKNTTQPTANAGPNQSGVTLCGLETATMDATLPSGASGQWNVISGTNGLFSLSNVQNTTFEPASYGGTTVARWTVTDLTNGCEGTDDVEITFTQPTNILSPQTDDLVWGGLTNSAWGNGPNWYEYQSTGYWKRMSTGFEPTSTDVVYIIPNSTGGICVSSSNNATTAGTESVSKLQIMDGATLELSNSTVNVYGDIINDGTVNPGSATVKMMGTGNQTISGTGTSTFNKLTVDKSNGNVIISQPVNVENTLKMTSGDIDNSQVLTLGTTGNTGTLSYSSGHILGKFKRHFDSDETAEMLFPVAKGAIKREGKIKFNQGPGPDQHLTMEVILGAPTQSQMTNNYNGLPFYASDQQLVQVYSNQAFVEIIPTANNYSSAIMSQPYTFEMHADNMSGVVNNQTVRLIKCAGSSNPNQHHTTWAPCGNHATVTGSNNDFWVKSTNVTGFSFFGFGSNNDNPLPVELVSFNGNCGDGVVELNWTTASEHNSAYYQLEKSRDGENWNVINTQDAAGNSNEMRSYSFVDAHASSGNNLYRLSQFDIDGDSKTYSVVNVNCAAANVGYFSTHPNPSTGEFHVVLNNEELIGTATIIMIDSRGTIVSQKEIEVMEGINVYNFNEFKVAPGMYYIRVVKDDKSTETIKQSIK